MNVIIDDELMAEALDITGLHTKKGVIEEALRTLVRLRKQEQVRYLRGKLQWEGALDISERLVPTNESTSVS